MAKRLPSAPPMLPGLTYVRPLGSGGFADVFLYEQDMPRRAVAVKVLPGDLRDPDLVRMFNAEADVLAHLSAHPSIVTVYQAGISADGRPYIVMEYCPGSLAQRYRIERIPVDEVLTIGVKMASALESSHRAGLVHRDIKPSNILLTSFGVPVLADFGIASSLARASHDEVFAMSVPWSAPEVVAEETTGTIASEVWGLGATVYSLLAGQSPFERLDRAQNTRDHLRRRILRATYTRIPRPDVPDALQEVLVRRDEPDAGRPVSERPRLRRGAARRAGGARPPARPRSRWRCRSGSPRMPRSTSGMPGCAAPRARASRARAPARPLPPRRPRSAAATTPPTGRCRTPRAAGAGGPSPAGSRSRPSPRRRRRGHS